MSPTRTIDEWSGLLDHLTMADSSSPSRTPEPGHTPGPGHTLDYALDDERVLTEPAQYRALFDDLRSRIVALLNERAATTQEVAQTVGRPKGTVGHHMKVLEAAGLIRVVRTKKVRAIEAKYYGRTARVFRYMHVHDAADRPTRILRDAAAEVAVAPVDEVDANVRHVRISPERAAEWQERLNALLVEFADQPRSGDTVYGLTLALYATTRTTLPAPEDTGDGGMP